MVQSNMHMCMYEYVSYIVTSYPYPIPYVQSCHNNMYMCM